MGTEQSQRGPLAVLVIWLLACLGLAIHAALHPLTHSVFPIYAIASRHWWAGVDMFSLQPETGDLYRYSPIFAVVTSPFAFLPTGVGNAAFKLVNVGIFAYGLWMWCRRALPVPLNRAQVARVFLVALLVISESFYNGQANLMMTGFLLLGMVALVEDRWWWAAGFLAAATLIKVFPLALAMVVGVLFWRTFPLRFLVAMLVGIALPFATQNPEYVADQTKQWFHHLVASVELNRDRLRSLDKLFEMSGAAIPTQAFLLLGAVAGAGVLAVTLLAARQGVERREVLVRSTTWFLTWVLMFGPSTENATFSILAPVLAWAVVDAFRCPHNWARCGWLLVSVYLVGFAGGDGGLPLRRLLGDFCWTTVGGAMFYALLIADLFHPRPRRF